MSVRIDQPPEWEPVLREEASRQGLEAERFISDLLRNELIANELAAIKTRNPPDSVADLRPRVAPSPGKSWIEGIVGKWPGNESDEEFERAVQELS